MPKRTNEFQTIVYHAYAHMAGPSDKVTESAFLKERGEEDEREVDILVERRTAGAERRIAVECRGRQRKDSIDWIDSLIGKFKDLGVDQVQAVSESGFTPSALRKAVANRIDAITLKPVTDQPWPEGLTSSPGLGGWSRKDSPQRIGVVTEPPYLAQVGINQPIYREDGTCICSVGDLGWLICRQSQDAISDSIQERFLEFFKKPDDMKPNAITAVIEGPFRLPLFLDQEGAKHRIVQIRLTIRCDFAFSRVEVEHFALGDARLTRGMIPCGDTGRAYSMTAIQAASKPGEFRCLSLPVRPADSEEDEDGAEA
jgi:hypothetical protein